MKKVVEALDGAKNYIFGAVLILLGILKSFTDIDFIEGITVLGISDPSTLISTGIAWILGRNAIKKIE